MRGKNFDGFPERSGALQDFFKEWESAEQIERVPLFDAVGRVAAKTLVSRNTLPVHRVSSCDGIAVKSEDFKDGMPDYKNWKRDIDFAAADTGDDFPDDFDAVIMAEEVDYNEDGTVQFISPDVVVTAGANISGAGSTIKKGDLLIEKNKVIRPADLASLAAGGVAMVPVRKKPRVAFIPTGSELIPASVIPKRGENIDTNSLLVGASLKELGAEPLIYPIIKDDRELLREAILEAVEEADAVILNAGTALGGEDYNYSILEKEGKLIHHYIAAAPGRPLAMAVIHGKPVINLPGPTIAAFFGIEWCLSAVIARLLRIPPRIRPSIEGVLTEDIRSNPKMAILCCMNAVRKPDGTYELHPVPFRGKGLSYALSVNAMYVSDVGESGRKKGEAIRVSLLRGEEFIPQE
jgi:molybdopterin molybdotransferase